MISKSVSLFCKNYKEIENYEEAIKSEKLWDCHHRLETHDSDGNPKLVQLSKKELIALDMYYNRPSEELIFISHREHTKLHKNGQLSGRSKKVICIETKEIFSSTICAERKYNLSESSIRHAIYRNGTAGKYHWKYIGEENA